MIRPVPVESLPHSSLSSVFCCVSLVSFQPEKPKTNLDKGRHLTPDLDLTCRKGVLGNPRTGRVSGQGVQKNAGQIQVLGQGFPETCTWDLRPERDSSPRMNNDTLLMMMTWRTHRRIPQISGCPRETRKTGCLRDHWRSGYYSDQETHTVSFGTVDYSTEEKSDERSGEGWYGDTDFVSHRQVLPRCSASHHLTKITVTFPDDTVRYLTAWVCSQVNFEKK